MPCIYNQCRKLIVLALILFGMVCHGYAQYRFTRFDPTNSNINSYSIHAVEKDHQYNIWFGTNNGLYRFDGERSHGYFSSINDKNSLAINIVSDIFCDVNGNIWVSTGGKLHRYLQGEDKFERINVDSFVGYIHFCKSTNKKVYFNDLYNIYLLDVDSKKITALSKVNPGKSIQKFFLHNEHDTLYIATAKGLYRSIDLQIPEQINAIKTKNGFPLCEKVISLSSTELLVTTWGCGFFVYNKRSGKTTQYLTNPGKEDITFGAIKKNDSIAWIGANTGIFVYNIYSHKIENHIDPDKKDMYGLHGNFIQDFCIDHQQNIWIAGNQGLEKYDLQFNNYRQYEVTFHVPENFNTNILDAFKMPNGKWVYGTYSGILIEDAARQMFPVKPAKPLPAIGSASNFFINDHGELFAVYEQYLVRLILEQKVIHPILKFPSDVIAITNGWNNDYWIGTLYDGIYRVKNNNIIAHYDTASKDLRLINNKIISLAVSADSVLAIGYNSEGLSIYDFKTKVCKYIYSEKLGDNYGNKLNIGINELYFRSILFHGANTLLVTTRTNGLMLLNLINNEARFVDENSGLSKTIHSIKVITKSEFLVKATNGLFYYNANTHHTREVSQELKITDNESYLYGADSLVNLYIINSNQRYHFSLPETITDFTPVTKITELTVNGKEITNWFASDITLNPDERMIGIHFCSNSFSMGHCNKFFYRITNVDTNWISLGNTPFINLMNVSPGQYLIEIKTRAYSSTEDKKPAKISINIRYPFYQRWWFSFLCVVVFIAIVYFIYRLRVQKEIEKHLLRNSISKDLHDEVGSTLSAVNIYSNLLSKDVADDNIKKMLAEKIYHTSKDAMEKMSEIVWSINPDKDVVTDLVQRIKVHTNSLLETDRVIFQIDENLNAVSLSSEVRKHSFLIFKEALINAIKYSGATQYTITFKKVTYNRLLLSLSDNGHGMDINSCMNKGNGLQNMNARAKLINSLLQITSTDKGTTVQLTIKIS